MRFLKAIYSAIYTVLGIACHLERLHGISPINFFVANFTRISQEKKKELRSSRNSLIFSSGPARA